jgi:cysteinyl-tRNA synthetase
MNKIAQNLSANPSQESLNLLNQSGDTLKRLGELLGILKENPIAYLAAKQQKVLKALTITPDEINKLITERNKARDEKNWARADEIRDELLAQQIEIKDSGDGTIWQVKI